MKKSMVTVSLLASLPFMALAGEGNKAARSKSSRQHMATPTPLPTEGLTKEQAEALDSIPNSSDVPEEERVRMEKEFERLQAEELAREKKKEALKKKN